MVDWDSLLDAKRVRGELGVSQSQLADLVGVSVRTVQSCEQRWRGPSVALEKSLLLLLLAFRNGEEFGQQVCYEAVHPKPGACDQCLARRSGQTHLCWLFSGNTCQGKRLHSWAEKKAACGECPFLHLLLGDGRTSDEV
jgi:DNA-binding XRE family transcriptional regulator